MTVRELEEQLEKFPHKDWEFDVLIPPTGADPQDRVILRVCPPEPMEGIEAIAVTGLPTKRMPELGPET